MRREEGLVDDADDWTAVDGHANHNSHVLVLIRLHITDNKGGEGSDKWTVTQILRAHASLQGGRLYVLCTMTSKPPNPRLKIYLIHIHCDIWPHGGQKIWFQPAVLLPFRAFWVVNQRKLILLAVNLQGSYLYLYRTELQKLHEVWKDFFKSYNLRPSATF